MINDSLFATLLQEKKLLNSSAEKVRAYLSCAAEKNPTDLIFFQNNLEGKEGFNTFEMYLILACLMIFVV